MSESDYQRGLRGGDFISFGDDQAWKDWRDGCWERERLERERERREDEELDRQIAEAQRYFAELEREERRREASLPPEERQRRQAERVAKERAAEQHRADIIAASQLADDLRQRQRVRESAKHAANSRRNNTLGWIVALGTVVGVFLALSDHDSDRSFLAPVAISACIAAVLAMMIALPSYSEGERRRANEAAADELEWRKLHTYSFERRLVTFCEISKCQCRHPKRCRIRDCDCNRPKVCNGKDCDCGFAKVCASPTCECERPKLATSEHFAAVL